MAMEDPRLLIQRLTRRITHTFTKGFQKDPLEIPGFRQFGRQPTQNPPLIGTIFLPLTEKPYFPVLWRSITAQKSGILSKKDSYPAPFGGHPEAKPDVILNVVKDPKRFFASSPTRRDFAQNDYPIQIVDKIYRYDIIIFGKVV